MNTDFSPLTSHLSPAGQRWQTRALVIGAAASVLSIIGGVFNHAQFFQSYLFAWLVWLGISLGALVVVMMQGLTGGMWGAAIRNLCWAAFMILPLMAVLSLPLLFGLHDIYAWSNGILNSAAGFHHKRQYLTVPFFVARSVVYFAVLLLLAYALQRRLREQPMRSPVALSAGGLISYVLCMNFASTDWVMSLDLRWYSTVFVIIFMAAQFLSALALMTAFLCYFANRSELPAKAFQDLGSMLMAFVIFWIYVSFSQLLIIWSGNLPREISWYLSRSQGGWQWVALLITVGEFLLPFALLLSREAKRTPRRLAFICICVVAINVVDVFWFVAPAFRRHLVVHWLDLAELVALGGFWFALFFGQLNKRPLLPTQLQEVAAHG